MKEISVKDRAEAIRYLKLVFRTRRVDDDQVSIQRFEDGISNKNYLVTFSDEETKYCLRIPGYGSEGMVDRLDEKTNNLLACEMGITPEVYYFDEKNGVKVVRYVEGAETLHADTIRKPENMEQIAKILRTLHSKMVRFHKDFNVFTEIHRYEHLLSNVNGEMYDGYYEVRSKVLKLEQRFNKLGIRVTPCHCDTLAENWLKGKDGAITLLDWEYSGMNDPFWDITAPFIEDDFTHEEEAYFLSAYFDGSVPNDASERVLYYKILMDYLWSIWARVKELDGATDLREYGIMRLNRGLNNLKLV